MAERLRRHGRRGIRSSLGGPALPDPDARIVRFELDARGALEVLRSLLPDELDGVRIGFATAPIVTRAGRRRGGGTGGAESELPLLYSIDRRARSIVLYRMPIQRARGLHIDDAEHRRLFVGHCLYRAVCEYLGREPWELLPGHFDHF